MRDLWRAYLWAMSVFSDDPSEPIPPFIAFTVAWLFTLAAVLAIASAALALPWIGSLVLLALGVFILIHQYRASHKNRPK